MPSRLSSLLLLSTLVCAHHANAEDQLLDSIVAVVNDGVVLESDIRLETGRVQRQARQSGQALPDEYILRQRVIERLIDQTLYKQRAVELGIVVDANSVNQAIDTVARNNRMNDQQLREALGREGIVWGDFRDDIERQVLFERLVDREVAARIRISEQEVDDFLKQADGGDITRYRLQHILVAIDPAASDARIDAANERADGLLNRLRAGEDFALLAASDSDGSRALNGGDLGWRLREELPEFARSGLDDMRVGDINGPVRSADGLHIFRLADKRNEGAAAGEETKVRHIYVANETPDARARVAELRGRAVAGEDFGRLAREFSEDPNSAPTGGELPWFTPGQMPPAFEEIAMALRPGDISDVFSTEFGWHVLEVMERRPVSSQSASLRQQAALQLRARKIEQESDRWARQLRDESFIEIR